jgi:hypothetical protein
MWTAHDQERAGRCLLIWLQCCLVKIRPCVGKWHHGRWCLASYERQVCANIIHLLIYGGMDNEYVHADCRRLQYDYLTPLHAMVLCCQPKSVYLGDRVIKYLESGLFLCSASPHTCIDPPLHVNHHQCLMIWTCMTSHRTTENNICVSLGLLSFSLHNFQVISCRSFSIGLRGLW